ncbi:MAG: extracellular solute-binding protein [Chloroflexi bacterium]|nr:extracellular solute-binding protein [Chloroflexota bacterium]
MVRFLNIVLVAILIGVLVVGCAPAVPAPMPTPTKAPVAAAVTPTPTKAPVPVATPTPENPVDWVELKAPVELVYWHTWTGIHEKAQAKLIDEFQKKYPNIKIKAEYAGDFTKSYQKLMAAIQAGSPPDMAVAYENNIANFAKAGVVVALDDYVASKKYGLSKESMDDFFKPVIQRVTYRQYGNKLLGFPFTVSDLIMYYNADMLKEAGVTTIPPKTWDEFLSACKAAKEKLGKNGYAVFHGPSPIHAMIYSFGGKSFSEDGTKALHDQPAGLKAFQLLETFIKGGYGYFITLAPTIGDDMNDFIAGKVAFIIRPSTILPFLKNGIKDKFKYGAALIPQAADNKDPATVMFGPSLAVFKSTPEKQLAAWEFLKFWTSREATVQWAIEAGFLPLRKSATEDPKYKAYLAADPLNRVAFEVMPYAKLEGPNIAAIGEIRNYEIAAAESVLTLKRSPEEAVKELTAKANKLLAESK